MTNVSKPINEVEKTLDSQLFHACAGGMVQMPPLNSKILYFPQGHAEHSGNKNLNFSDSRRIPPYILCHLSDIKFMADSETDEVYAKLSLLPLKNQNQINSHFNHNHGGTFLGFDNNKNEKEKPSFFAKTLTQSDANNGGGFSVPRYCAETIFPPLDYAADPPVQTLLVKDVHGQIWKFRHIYRGTPRRHLLTTGWSSFVNHKKLVAGDSIVFLRADNGDLCVGIRRAKRGFVEGSNSSCLYGNGPSAESVVEAANRGADGEAFEVVYYPRASTPEFCVKAETVEAAMAVQWCAGMRFKMGFETEDSSRISWFMGTVSAVQVDDQVRWPNSPWRLLQVSWDEPELLQNVKRVNPWLVELVASMPAIHMSPFSPPRKKMRLPQVPDFPLLITPPSIQGARHSSPLGFDHHLLVNQAPPYPTGFPNHEPGYLNPVQFQERDENVSCVLPKGNPSTKVCLELNLYEKNKKHNKKKRFLMLFGQPILLEEELPESVSGDTADGSVVLQNGSVNSSYEEDGSWLETGQCEVFMESENISQTVDLLSLGSYEELKIEVARMFGLDKSDRVLDLVYRNADGAVKHTGDEPFSEFSKVARKLTIITNSSAAMLDVS